MRYVILSVKVQMMEDDLRGMLRIIDATIPLLLRQDARWSAQWETGGGAHSLWRNEEVQLLAANSLGFAIPVQTERAVEEQVGVSFCDTDNEGEHEGGRGAIERVNFSSKINLGRNFTFRVKQTHRILILFLTKAGAGFA